MTSPAPPSAPSFPARNAPAPARPTHGLLPVLAAAVTVVLWASAFVAVRAAGHDFSPGSLALGRQLAAVTALTAVVLVRAIGRGAIPRLPRGRVLLGVVLWGVAWFGLYNVALNAAERSLDAGTTALLVNLGPVLVAVLAGLLLGEGFPRRLVVGIAIAFAGVGLIAATSGAGDADVTGVLLGLAAAALYASSATGQKRLLSHVDALTMTWLGCAAGMVACAPFAADLARDLATAPATSTFSVAYLGVFPTAIAFLTWGYALARTSAGQLAASTYAVPPIVVLMSWLTLSEVPAPSAFVGGALCLLGVAVATLGRVGTRRRAPVAEVTADGGRRPPL